MMYQASEKDIILELSKGNSRVFDSLYKRYYRRLYALSFKYTRDKQLAEEAVHDVFVKIWRHAGRIDISHSLSSYLSKAVVNSSLNLLKAQKRQYEQRARLEVECLAEMADYDEAEELERKLLLLNHAIDQLPTQCKKVLLMSKFEKLKQQEIADRLNISIKTVKNHMTYAFNKIRQTISATMLIVVSIIIGGVVGLFK